jgi:adenosylcobinamide-GDP ribazoletransferase
MKYAREGEGTAKDFFEGTAKTNNIISLLIPVAFSLLLGLKLFLVTNLIFILLSAALLLFFKKKLGGETGDTLGASCEITEAVILILMCLNI